MGELEREQPAHPPGRFLAGKLQADPFSVRSDGYEGEGLGIGDGTGTGVGERGWGWENIRSRAIRMSAPPLHGEWEEAKQVRGLIQLE